MAEPVIWAAFLLALVLPAWLIIRRKAARRPGGIITRQEAALLRTARDALVMLITARESAYGSQGAEESRAGAFDQRPREVK